MVTAARAPRGKLRIAGAARSAVPLAAAYQMFLATSGRGDGAADDSQVIRSYSLLNGTA